MTGAGGGLAVGLLGPMLVSVGGLPVQVRPGRLRALVVVLALSAGRTVSVDRLAVAVWGDDLPQDVRGSVQNYVWRLRGLLGGESIGTDGEGYVLRMTPQDVDGLRFVGMLDAAAQLSDTAKQMALLDEALALWRGSPFEGVRSAWLQESEAPRLVERYLAAVERRVDLAVAENRGTDLAPQLRVLTAQHPMRESLWARLLVVLDRGGRPAEALERYETIRRRLADELGVDPGPDLQEIYADLLARPAPALAGTSGPAAAVRETTRQVVPRQLPADIDSFAGRDAALAMLDALLGEENESARRPVVITAIAGTAGVGKTSLAVHWAHRVADRFPDGQLYVNLRGFAPHGRVTAPADAVRTFLDALHMPAQQIPAAFEAQVGLYRSLLAGKRMLVVLDNARDADQVRPLLPGAPGCLVVITSRNQLASLVATHGACPVTLDLLSHDEARQLLARRLGAERIDADPRAVEEIIDRCARLPLALAIVAARAATHPTFDLDTVAGNLGDTRNGLDTLADNDPTTDIRAVFSWSYHTLSTDGARLYRLLGLHPGPDTAAPAAASLTGLPLSRVQPLLTELTRGNLAAEHTPGRYALHDLLRAYAIELAHTRDTDADRRAAVHRMLDYYLHTANIADQQLGAREAVVPDPLQPGATSEDVADHNSAMAWFAAEHPILRAAIDRAANDGFDNHAWHLAWLMSEYLERQGYWDDWVTTQQVALKAANRLGDKAEQARAHRGLARAHTRRGCYEDAHSHLRRALDLYGAVHDCSGRARTHLSLGTLFDRQGRHTEALDQTQQALGLFLATGERGRQADALNAVGWCHAQLDEHRQALNQCQDALHIYQELGDRHGQAYTWDSLGYAHHQLGDHQQATTCYRQALDLLHAVGAREYEADVLTHLGDTHHAAGDLDPARGAWRHALDILTELNHPDADALRTKLSHLASTVDEPRCRTHLNPWA